MTVTTTIEYLFAKYRKGEGHEQARLAQSVERQALNLVVGGSSPPVGDSIFIAFRLFEHGDGMSSSSFEWC